MQPELRTVMRLIVGTLLLSRDCETLRLTFGVGLQTTLRVKTKKQEYKSC